MSFVRASMVLSPDDKHWLSEQLETIGNMTEIAQLLIEQDRLHLLATVLEYIYMEAQGIVNTHCVVNQ